MPKREVYLWTFYNFLLEMCVAQDLHCTVTHEGGGTRYSVPEFNQTGCDYQWINGTNFTLATHETPMDKQVVMKSNWTLLTFGCSELIRYNRDCLSEGSRREATCTTNCSGHAGQQTGDEIAHYNWIVPTVVLLLLLLLLLLLGLGMRFLYYRFKNRTFRCGKPVPTEDTEQHA